MKRRLKRRLKWRPWRMRDRMTLRPLDFKKYANIPEDRLIIMLAGSSAIYRALFAPNLAETVRLASEMGNFNRRRFHQSPIKTSWRGKWE